MRQISDIGVGAAKNPMVRMTTARILIADYGLIKKDFPFTASWTNERIDAWLLDQTGYPAKTQRALGSEVNSPVRTDGTTREAWRPEGYGRGAVYPVNAPDGSEFGLIDAKGTGAVLPRQESHGSGLMSSGEGLREFFYEKYISGILEHRRSDWGTVGTYAVIDWGFDELHPDGSKVPAGSVLRQAHVRVEGRPGYQYLPAGDARSLELTLRTYGISATGDSAVKGGGLSVNLQGSTDKKLVDFGHMIQLSELPREPTGNYGDPAWVRLLDPSDPDAIKASHPEVSETVAAWGPYPGRKTDPKFDQISGSMHDLAQAFRDGRVSRQDIVRAYYGRVEAGLARVRSTPGGGTESDAMRLARTEGQLAAARRYLSESRPRGALSLARASGLPSHEWAEKLVTDARIGAFYELADALASNPNPDDIELAILVVRRIPAGLPLMGLARKGIGALPPTEARTRLIRALIEKGDEHLIRVLALEGLKNDTSPDALETLIAALKHPDAFRSYSPPDLQQALQKLRIWDTLPPDVQQTLREAAGVSAAKRGPILTPLLAPALDGIHPAGGQASGCSSVLSQTLRTLLRQ